MLQLQLPLVSIFGASRKWVNAIWYFYFLPSSPSPQSWICLIRNSGAVGEKCVSPTATHITGVAGQLLTAFSFLLLCGWDHHFLPPLREGSPLLLPETLALVQSHPRDEDGSGEILLLLCIQTHFYSAPIAEYSCWNPHSGNLDFYKFSPCIDSCPVLHSPSSPHKLPPLKKMWVEVGQVCQLPWIHSPY